MRWFISCVFSLFTSLVLAGAPSINPRDIKPGTVGTNEFGALAGVTSNIQAQLNTLASGATNDTLATVTARGSTTTQNLHLAGHNNTIGTYATEGWGSSTGNLNVGYMDAGTFRTNEANGGINMGFLAYNGGYSALQELGPRAFGSLNLGSLYHLGQQRNYQFGSWNIGSGVGTQVHDAYNPAFPFPSTQPGGNLNLGYPGYQRTGPNAYGSVNMGYSGRQDVMGRGSINAGYNYGSVQTNNSHGSLNFGYSVFGYKQVDSDGSENHGYLSATGAGSSYPGAYQIISGGGAGYNFGYLHGYINVPLSQYSVPTQMLSSANGSMNIGFLLGGGVGSTDPGGLQINSGAGSVQIGFLQANEYQIMSGSGSLSVGANITNSHNYSVVLGYGLNSMEANSTHARRYWENGVALDAKYLQSYTDTLSSVTFRGSNTTANLALRGSWNSLSYTNSPHGTEGWDVAGVGMLNFGYNSGTRTNAGYGSENHGYIYDSASILNKQYVLGNGSENHGAFDGERGVQYASGHGSVNWGYLARGSSSLTGFQYVLGNGSENHGAAFKSAMQTNAGLGSINFGVVTNTNARQTIGPDARGAFNFGYVDAAVQSNNATGSVIMGGSGTNTHDYSMVFGNGQISYETDSVSARKYFENGISLDAKYPTYPISTNIAASVATNIVNGYIVGSGYMYMAENVGTSVLYHVTLSGTHTNKIGEFYTP